jgi:hypothetical protein
VLQITFPKWPLSRLLHEAVEAWNARHPESSVDWLTVEWPRLQTIAHAFIRHALSDYDEALREAPSQRKVFRAQLFRAAISTYPALKPGAADPRLSLEETKQPALLLDYLARNATEACEASHRLRDLLRVRGANKEIKTELRELEAQRAHCTGLLNPKPGDEFNIPGIVWPIPRPGYDFARLDLYPNQYRFLKFSCPACQVRIAVTKRPVAIGQGKRGLVASCHCFGAIFPVSLDGSVPDLDDPDSWRQIIEQHPRPSSPR